MKELITIEKGTYHSLLKAKLDLQEQTQKYLKLHNEFRELEKRYFTLLTNSSETASKIVSLGDYVESVRD